MSARVLSLSHGTSRGHETYGYTIVSLLDTDTGKRYRCMGGGYDMVGTVFADWLQDTHQPELQSIGAEAYYQPGGNGWETNGTGLYGMRLSADGTVSLDGGCGFESIRRIAKVIGLSVRTLINSRGHATGFVIERAA